jgi:hypothetical protein
MSEGNTPNPKIGKRAQSPSKITPIEDENNLKSNKIINMTEQVINKNKSLLLGKLTEDFIDEEESEGISITYKEQNKKIKTISLDLLLKKIVTENFIEQNPIQIYSFCQQCFCFIQKELLFNKIFNCYNFYKEKKAPISQIGNLIKFLNILVIEMYEYYTSISHDDPSLTSLKNFYNSLICEIVEIIDNEEEQKKQEENLNINDFQNKLEEYNEEENTPEESKINEDRCSEFMSGENRERYGTIAGRKDDGRFSSYLDENKNITENISRKTVNISSKKLEKEQKKKNKEKEKEKEKEKKKEDKKEKKKYHLFDRFRKEKPVKVENKNEEEDEKDEIQENLKKIELMKNLASTPEEAIINCVRYVLILFSTDEPNKSSLRQAKNTIDFYKDINKKMAEAIGKTFQETKTKHNFAKSVTVGNIKKTKLKLHENDGFFNVLDWDKKDIGEKLISVSKKLINKVQRREIYKAVFLKKNKEKTSPNVLENIDKFNRLIFFIIQDILSYDFAKDRIKIVEKWIKIADYCRSRKDYNDVVAINSALNNYIITGLKKTMNEINKDKKDLSKQISKLCRVQGNYKKMREDMKSLEYNDFYVPYLGMILKDLAFFEENSQYLVNDVLINMEKLEKVQIAVSEFFNFKNTNDKDYTKPPEELDFFDNLEDLNELDLEKLANNLEPEFKLYNAKKREKRQTNIDIKYFTGTTVHRPNMRDSKRLSSHNIHK